MFRTHVTAWKTRLRIFVLILTVVTICATNAYTFHMDKWIQRTAALSILLSYYLLVYIWWRRDRRAAEREEHQ